MSVEVLGAAPRRTWWQKLLRKMLGAHDLVAVVATQHWPDGRTLTNTFWLDGVDVTQPISVGEGDEAVVIQPLSEDTT